MSMPQMPVIGTKYEVDCALSCMQIVENEWLRVYVTHGAVPPWNYIHWNLVVGYTQLKPKCMQWRDTILKTNVLGCKNLQAPTECSTVPNITVPVPWNVIHDVCSSVSPSHISPLTKPESHLHQSFQLLPLLSQQMNMRRGQVNWKHTWVGKQVRAPEISEHI